MMMTYYFIIPKYKYLGISRHEGKKPKSSLYVYSQSACDARFVTNEAGNIDM